MNRHKYLLALLFPLLMAADWEGTPIRWPEIKIADRRTWADTTMLIGFVSARAGDWWLTRDLVTDPEKGCEESCRFIRGNPSKGTVDGFFALTTAALVGVSLILPVEWRRGLYLGGGIVSVAAVYNNKQVEIKAERSF